MLTGHFALGVAARPLAPRVPLWALLVAPMLTDMLFWLLALAWIEGVSPSGTRSYPPQNDQFHYHDYSHSLLAAVALGFSPKEMGLGRHIISPRVVEEKLAETAAARM